MFGETVGYSFDDASHATLRLDIAEEAKMPNERHRLLKSGSISTRPMSKTDFYDMYNDYIASTTLRVARDALALLPMERVLASA